MGLLLLQGASDLNPRELFASGEQGLWLDPSQMSTLYQDSNGVTPCTAAGDPVGLILDQSRGGLSQIGADLVTNGGFAADTDWTKGANWTIGSGVATKTGGAANNLTQTIGSTAAAWYRISLDVTRSAGTLTVSLGTSGTTYAITATGSYTFFILAGSGTQTLTLAGDSSFAGTVDNVVVRNVPGNHAYQTTSASRPTLARIPSSGRRNLLTRTEELDNAAWVKTNVSAASATNLTYNGGSTPSAAFLQQNVTIAGGTASKTFTLRVVLSGSGKVRIKNTHGGVLDNFSSDITLSSTPTAYTLTVTNGASAGNGLQSFGINPATDNTVFDVTVAQLQAEESASATNYQKVVATTDVTESGVSDLWHLVFDGSDDSLVTNSVDFTGTDEMTVIAGVRKLSDAATAMILESSANVGSNSGSFYLTAAELTGASGNFSFKTRGDVNPAAYANSGTILAPATRVISGLGDISSDVASIRINSTQTDYSADQGSGNFGNYQLFIGRRNQATLPYNGHLYQLIVRGKTTPTGKLLEAERFVGRKTGVSF